MSFDVMRVRLHLRGVRVTGVVVDTPAELVVGVVSVRTLSSCPFCGLSCQQVHDRRRREIRDLEHGGRSTVLLWTQRRFVCGHCGKRHMENHPQFEGSITRRLARRLVRDAQVMPISAVSRHHRVGWHLVMGLVADWSGLVEDHRRQQSCRVLLIDETSIRKRHRYVTVILNGDTGEMLAMVEGRSKAALSRFFIAQGPRWCQNVKTVVTDGSPSYRAAIHRYLPTARHVLDRFHATRWFAQGLTLVRRELQRRQPPGVKPAFHPDLFRARFCLLRRNDHLTTADRKRLDRLFAAHPRLRVAWDALQELYSLYQADDLQGALDALQRFADLYETGQIPEYHNTVDTILNWSDEILNWHHSRRSNGPLEGTNNLIQTLRRTAHGFTNPQNYAARGLLLT